MKTTLIRQARAIVTCDAQDHEAGEMLPRVVDDACRVQRGAVGAPAAVAEMLHSVRHRPDNLRRLAQRGGGVVQIDHGLMTLEAPASFSTMEYMDSYSGQDSSKDSCVPAASTCPSLITRIWSAFMMVESL